jgi:hypothetical protein
MYDKEFGEIQRQVAQMGAAKRNGVSWFSVGGTNVLLGNANDPYNPNANNGKSGIAFNYRKSLIPSKPLKLSQGELQPQQRDATQQNLEMLSH